MMHSLSVPKGLPLGFLVILGTFLIAAGPGQSVAGNDPPEETESDPPPPPVGVAPT